MADAPDFIPLQFERLPPEEQEARLTRFAGIMSAPEPPLGPEVDLEVVREAIRTAGTSPSGANLQPWRYVIVTSPERKRSIRRVVEQEEPARLAGLPEVWRRATPRADKRYLEEAPCLIAVFRVNYRTLPGGRRLKHYYVHESVSLSVSFLLAALRHAGVGVRVEPPVAPLSLLLGRPSNESPFLLLAVGGGTAPGSLEAARAFYQQMRTRRVIREFSGEPVPVRLVQKALAVANAGIAPAGLRPWRFELVSEPAVRRQIRALAEEEERRFYESRITPEWREALAPLGTDWRKPFLEIAPHLVVCFKVEPRLSPAAPPPRPDGFLRGRKLTGTLEAAGMAAGRFIAALHHAGLACLTHTPSPMNFLRDALGGAQNETPFLLLPVGYPAEGCRVPNIQRKPLEEIMKIV